MKRDAYLFDTHALVFWSSKTAVSAQFIAFFDKVAQEGVLYVSAISFWEIAFLVQKGRLAIADIHAWKNELLHNTMIQLINPTAEEMIDSTLLPPHHKDPFDRLLIAQANRHKLTLITQDQEIPKYEVAHLWL